VSYRKTKQLRFASIPLTARADFAGGGLSSDLGPVLLRGVDLQIGLTKRIAAALPNRRHQSYVSRSPRRRVPIMTVNLVGFANCNTVVQQTFSVGKTYICLHQLLLKLVNCLILIKVFSLA
jgi:hypothetical protein